MLHPGLDEIDQFDCEMVFDSNGMPVGFALKNQPNGWCIYNTGSSCAVWPNQPGVCKAFDCRGYAKSSWAKFLDPEGNNPVMVKGRSLS